MALYLRTDARLLNFWEYDRKQLRIRIRSRLLASVLSCLPSQPPISTFAQGTNLARPLDHSDDASNSQWPKLVKQPTIGIRLARRLNPKVSRGKQRRIAAIRSGCPLRGLRRSA